MPQLEHLILQFQKLGTTSTQIILTPVNHGELDALCCNAVHKNGYSLRCNSAGCSFFALWIAGAKQHTIA